MKMFSVRTALVGHNGSWELPACEQAEEEEEEEEEKRATRQKVTWPAGTLATLNHQERAQPTHACAHSANSTHSEGVRPTQDLAEFSRLSQRLSVDVHASSRASGMLNFTGLFCSGIGLLHVSFDICASLRDA
jgi:hypothetical protein